MTNFVNFQIEATDENKDLINQIAEMITGGNSAAVKKETKTEKKEEQQEKSESKGVSLADLKKATKKAKDDHGDDFIKSVLKTIGAEIKDTIPKSISALDAELHEKYLAELEKGPQENEESGDWGEDEWGEDESNDSEEETEIDPQTVKEAVQAYAKTESRDKAMEILKDNGLKALSEIQKASKKKLIAIMKAVV